MKTQMNFEGGVNAKHNGPTASMSEAEAGESKRSVQDFPCEVEPPKARTPRPGAQMNFEFGK